MRQEGKGVKLVSATPEVIATHLPCFAAGALPAGPICGHDLQTAVLCNDACCSRGRARKNILCFICQACRRSKLGRGAVCARSSIQRSRALVRSGLQISSDLQHLHALTSCCTCVSAPRVLNNLIRPSGASTYSGPATAWPRLLGSALRPHTLLLTMGGLLRPQQQQFVREYLFLLLPAAAVAVVSLLSILNRIHLLKPLLSAAWSTRTSVLAAACTGVSAHSLCRKCNRRCRCWHQAEPDARSVHLAWLHNSLNSSSPMHTVNRFRRQLVTMHGALTSPWDGIGRASCTAGRHWEWRALQHVCCSRIRQVSPRLSTDCAY